MKLTDLTLLPQLPYHREFRRTGHQSCTQIHKSQRSQLVNKYVSQANIQFSERYLMKVRKLEPPFPQLEQWQAVMKVWLWNGMNILLHAADNVKQLQTGTLFYMNCISPYSTLTKHMMIAHCLSYSFRYWLHQYGNVFASHKIFEIKSVSCLILKKKLKVTSFNFVIITMDGLSE